MTYWDKHYLTQLYHGESQAYSFLYEKYKKKIYNYIWNFLNYDTEAATAITTDVFIKLFEYWSKNLVENFNALAYRTAHNLSVNWINKRQKETYIKDDKQRDEMQDKWIDSHDNMKANTNKEYRKDALHQCLEHLSPDQREVLYLYFFEQKDYNEIADLIGSNKNSVGTMISRAKKKLQSIAESNWFQNIFIS